MFLNAYLIDFYLYLPLFKCKFIINFNNSNKLIRRSAALSVIYVGVGFLFLKPKTFLFFPVFIAKRSILSLFSLHCFADLPLLIICICLFICLSTSLLFNSSREKLQRGAAQAAAASCLHSQNASKVFVYPLFLVFCLVCFYFVVLSYYSLKKRKKLLLAALLVL